MSCEIFNFLRECGRKHTDPKNLIFANILIYINDFKNVVDCSRVSSEFKAYVKHPEIWRYYFKDYIKNKLLFPADANSEKVAKFYYKIFNRLLHPNNSIEANKEENNYFLNAFAYMYFISNNWDTVKIYFDLKITFSLCVECFDLVDLNISPYISKMSVENLGHLTRLLSEYNFIDNRKIFKSKLVRIETVALSPPNLNLIFNSINTVKRWQDYQDNKNIIEKAYCLGVDIINYIFDKLEDIDDIHTFARLNKLCHKIFLSKNWDNSAIKYDPQNEIREYYRTHNEALYHATALANKDIKKYLYWFLKSRYIITSQHNKLKQLAFYGVFTTYEIATAQIITGRWRYLGCGLPTYRDKYKYEQEKISIKSFNVSYLVFILELQEQKLDAINAKYTKINEKTQATKQANAKKRKEAKIQLEKEDKENGIKRDPYERQYQTTNLNHTEKIALMLNVIDDLREHKKENIIAMLFKKFPYVKDEDIKRPYNKVITSQDVRDLLDKLKGKK
jgi:hypothetical protein